jgi:hypothetical protein
MRVIKKIIYILLSIALFFIILKSDYLPTAENKAKKAVSSILIDPDSAKFENVFKGKVANSYCGFVNAKNRLGGYTGASAFIYDGAVTSIISKLPEREDFESYYLSLRYSSSQAEDKYIELSNGCQFPKKWKDICGVELFPLSLNELCNSMNAPEEFVGALYREFSK